MPKFITMEVDSSDLIPDPERVNVICVCDREYNYIEFRESDDLGGAQLYLGA